MASTDLSSIRAGKKQAKGASQQLNLLVAQQLQK